MATPVLVLEEPNWDSLIGEEDPTDVSVRALPLRRVALPLPPMVRGEQVTVGRGKDCHVVVPFGTVSRSHALLRCDERARIFITDAGSQNGTLVNGEPVECGQWKLLPDDSLVMLGDLELWFVFPKSLLHELRFERRGQATGT